MRKTPPPPFGFGRVPASCELGSGLRCSVEVDFHECLWALHGESKALLGENHDGIANEEVRVLL